MRDRRRAALNQLELFEGALNAPDAGRPAQTSARPFPSIRSSVASPANSAPPSPCGAPSTRRSSPDLAAAGPLSSRTSAPSLKAAKTEAARKIVSATAPAASPESQARDPAADEWWTTQMVCAFLKVSRKTLWERRRNPALAFPRPVNLGGSRNVYRASAVRGWAESKALAELCELG